MARKTDRSGFRVGLAQGGGQTGMALMHSLDADLPCRHRALVRLPKRPSGVGLSASPTRALRPRSYISIRDDRQTHGPCAARGFWMHMAISEF